MERREDWVMRQRWHSLLFAHWRIPIEAVRARIPAELEVDTFHGEAWVGVVPFGMSGVRFRYTAAVPGLSAFPELNVRTYVTAGGKPGVFFFSLDADSRLAVRAARRFLSLPYYYASMRLQENVDGWFDFDSRRAHAGAAEARFRARYRPTGAARAAEPGSLNYFLAERYCFYTKRDGGVHRCDIRHEPWPLQPAEAEIEEINLPGVEAREAPLLHFARAVDTVAWPLRRV